jgi:hypothetical protein
MHRQPQPQARNRKTVSASACSATDDFNSFQFFHLDTRDCSIKSGSSDGHVHHHTPVWAMFGGASPIEETRTPPYPSSMVDGDRNIESEAKQDG